MSELESALQVYYYSLDGSFNNLADPNLGSTNSSLLAVAPLAYGDGYSTFAGGDRPNPRVISNALAQQDESMPDPRGLTNFIWAWGQFLDHDLDLTPELSDTEAASQDRFINIPVPVGDPYLDPFSTGTRVIEMRDTVFIEGTGTDPGNPRQLPNIITSWMDGSQIYGSSEERAAALRSFFGGGLLISEGNLLPLNTLGLENNNPGQRPAESFFVAGDVRVNENVVLSSMHTLFVREHNRLAQELALTNPDWTDEQIYQRARQINIAQTQSITYNEYLPTLLGVSALTDYGGYDPTIDPGISRVFSTAAFRLGHTQLSTKILRLDNDGNVIPQGNLTLAESFFPGSGALQAAGIDAILRGLAAAASQQVDTKTIDDVRSLLFGFGPAASARDLFAINIQRGRANGLADYNTVRAAFGLDRVESFAEMTGDLDKQAALESLYGSVDNIDAFVGMLAEDLQPGASVGETVSAVLVDQFSRLRAGDRLYYENHFSPAEIAELEGLQLSDIILRNTDTQAIQGNVFHSGNLELEMLVTPMPTPSVLDLASSLDKPQALTFTYTGDYLLRTNQKPGKADAWGVADDDPFAYVVVANKADADKVWAGKAKTYFAGTVAWGEEFTADVAIAGKDKFTSKTFLLLYEDEAAYLQGAEPLQVAEYSTSGSQPMCLGDAMGSFALTGYVGEDGEESLPPTSVSTGLEIAMDSSFLVTYQLSNTGELALKPTQFQSPDGTAPYYMKGDLNANHLLDAGETWEYMNRATALPGQQTMAMDIMAIASNGAGDSLGLPSLTASDSMQYMGVQAPPFGDLGQRFGKVNALTFQYVATDRVLTGGKNNDQNGKAKIEDGVSDDDISAYLVVSSSNDVDNIKEGKKPLYFAGTVEVGQSFTASLDFAHEDEFKGNTRILVFEDEAAFIAGADPLQVSTYKTNGSQPVAINDLVGAVQLKEYQGETGGYDDPDIDPLTGQIGKGFSVVGLLGDPQTLTLQYSATLDLLTGGKDNNQGGKAKILSHRNLDGDGTSFIRVSDKASPTDLGGNEYFEGLVSFGETFTASVFAPTADANQFGRKTYFHYFDDLDGPHLGSVVDQTDGPQPMELGDQLSGSALVGYVGTEGSASLL